MPVQLTLLCGMPRTFRIAQGWGPNPSPGCLHFIILVALFYFQRFPQSIPCVKKSQFGLTYLSLTQGVTGVLLSPRPFSSPGSGGRVLSSNPHTAFLICPCLQYAAPCVCYRSPAVISCKAGAAFPDSSASMRNGCYSDNSPPMHPPLVSILFIFHFNMLLQSPPLRYPSFSPPLSHSQHLLC